MTALNATRFAAGSQIRRAAGQRRNTPFRHRPERGTNTHASFYAAIRSPVQSRPAAYLEGATGAMVGARGSHRALTGGC
jgi:hypothetical protein